MKLALATLLCTVAAPALAAPRERAAVGAIDLGGGVPAYLGMKVSAPIEQGLAAAGYEVVPTPEVRARLTGELATCRAGACLRLMSEALKVDALVLVAIVRKDDSSIITVRLYGPTGVQLAEVHEVCDLCGDAELIERIGVAASALRARAMEARAQAVPPAPRPRPVIADDPPSTIPGFALGVAGVAVLGTGIYLLAIDGKGTCHAGDTPVYPDPVAVIRYPDPTDQTTFVCRDVYHTRTLGFAGLGVGALAVAAGAFLVVHAWSHDRAVEVTPQPGGAIVGARWAW